MNIPPGQHGRCVRCRQFGGVGCQQFGLQCVIPHQLPVVGFIGGTIGLERPATAAYAQV